MKCKKKLAIQLKNFHFRDLTGIQTEAKCGSDQMKTLYSRSSRIKYQHVTFSIPDDLKYMGMPAHEDIRLQFVYEFTCPYVIPSGIATYMNHEHLETFTFKEAMYRMSISQVIVVTVSSNTYKRLEGRDFLSGLKTTAEIARVPNLIHRSEELAKLLAEYAMRIGYETYIFLYSFINIFLLYRITAITRCRSI